MSAQNNSNTQLPFSKIPQYETDYTSGNVVKRFVDGLGFRYYWATEGLTEKDLTYQPTPEARKVKETMEHLYGLSETILNAALNKANVRPADFSGFTYEELRSKTLENLEKASANYAQKNEEDLLKMQVIFESNGKQRNFPFWNMLNGPISDAIYHVGQIVSFRRITGNPINPKVNVFRGALNK